MRLNTECRTYIGDKKEHAESESGKTFRLINNSGFDFAVYKVDFCLIKDNNEKKCDFLFIVDRKHEHTSYFVELKGAKLADAINQITNSVNILCKSLHEHKMFGRIVCSRVTPDIKSRRAKLDEIFKGYGGNLIIASKRELLEKI